jgi:DNA-binding transcriptional LysR family regulator
VAELVGEPYLERLNCEYVAYYIANGDPFDIDLDIRYRSEHEEWIQAMIQAGMGCSCMPEYTMLLPAMNHRQLVEPSIRRTISVATVRGRKHTPAIDLFTRLCMELHREGREAFNKRV